MNEVKNTIMFSENELLALKLKNIEGLTIQKVAERMDVSKATANSLIKSIDLKISKVLFEEDSNVTIN